MAEQPPEHWSQKTKDAYWSANAASSYAESASALLEFAHALAEEIRGAVSNEDGRGMKWNWWDAATIPGSCADLIDPKAEHDG